MENVKHKAREQKGKGIAKGKEIKRRRRGNEEKETGRGERKR